MENPFISLINNTNNKFFPPYSKRRFFAKLIFVAVRYPLKFILKLSPKRLYLFFSVLKNDGIFEASRRLNNHFFDNKIPQYSIKLNLIKTNKNLNKISDYEPLIFPKKNAPVVSIIIPVYNQFNYTYNCLKSIYLNTGNDIDYEVIIANDSSTDFTTEIENIVSNILLISTPTNLKFLKNCNHAAKHSNGKYILFLNNDTQVQKNWLFPLVKLIEEDNSIGAVGSKILQENGTILEAVGIIWNDGSACNYGRNDDPSLPEFNYVKEVDYLSGAAMMVKKSIWDEIGGFDERYVPAYYEDPDLCFSIRKLGYKVMYQPESVVVHFEGISHGKNIKKGQKQFQAKNQKIFFEKWKNEIEKEHFSVNANIFYARDRSRNKKTILIIDDYVPRYDINAGSRTVFQYLNLFLQLGYNIKFIDNTFHRNEPYTSILEQLGIEVLYGPYFARNWKIWLKKNGNYIDFAFLNRPNISIKYIDTIKQYSNAKILYYGHDLHFLREQKEYDIKKDKKLLKSSMEWKNIETEIFGKADISYFPSQIEVDEIKKINTSFNVKTIPAYIYKKKLIKKRDFIKTKDIMFVGGFFHNPNTDGVLWYINHIYPELKKKRPEIKTYIIGSNVPDEISILDIDNLIITGFVTDKQLNDYYNNCRLSIVPLRYGGGIKGKTIEAMYNQMPIVTTSIGAEGIKDAEKCLFIKDDPLAFAEEIIKVYDNLELLADVSIKEIEIINESFTSEAALKVISGDFKC